MNVNVNEARAFCPEHGPVCPEIGASTVPCCCEDKHTRRRYDTAEPVDTWSLDLEELLQEVGILMRDRHRKYGSGNIAKRGIPGILVRLDDKLARIDNGDMDYADESYRDAWMDVVGYGLVALMAIDGNWPGLQKPSSRE